MRNTVSFVEDWKRKKERRRGLVGATGLPFLNDNEEASNGKSKFEGIAEFEIILIEKYLRPRMSLIVIAKLAADGKDNIVTKNIEGLRVSIPKDALNLKDLSYL